MEQDELALQLLERGKQNPNTAEYAAVVVEVVEKIRWVESINLHEVTPDRAKAVLRNRDFLDLLLGKLMGLLCYVFAVEDELQRKDDCIAQLFNKNKQLEIDLYLMRQHCEALRAGGLAATNSYLNLYKKHNPTHESQP